MPRVVDVFYPLDGTIEACAPLPAVLVNFGSFLGKNGHSLSISAFLFGGRHSHYLNVGRWNKKSTQSTAVYKATFPLSPTNSPSNSPTNSPVSSPTNSPVSSPTNSPSILPTNSPTSSPIGDESINSTQLAIESSEKKSSSAKKSKHFSKIEIVGMFIAGLIGLPLCGIFGYYLFGWLGRRKEGEKEKESTEGCENKNEEKMELRPKHGHAHVEPVDL